MIEFNNLKINRFIIHTIIAKQNSNDSAKIEASNEISSINTDVLEIFRNRLIAAAGRNSKAFELEIEDSTANSFFELSKNIFDHDDEKFILKTTEIAELLAQSQRKVSIPGGFLIILDCLNEVNNLPVIIVIKAEPHEALQFSNFNGQTQVNVLEKVFLSPSQKLYKIGMIYKKTNQDVGDLNEKFGFFLYDDQFRTDNHPAEYFYKDFLGFTVGNNSKIQSQIFYKKTEDFIKRYIDNNSKNLLLLELKNQFLLNQNSTINPINFANTYIPIANDLRDKYIREVCHDLPHSIVKDISLISKKLTNRIINFPNKINLSGPEEDFDSRVEIIEDTDLNRIIDLNISEYTILKILGKPYFQDE